MKISARNQFEGTISSVVEGSVNGVVTIDFEGYAIKADITMESIKGLELAEGKKAFAIIKASNVMFAAGGEPIKNISARNQLVGTVTAIKENNRKRKNKELKKEGKCEKINEENNVEYSMNNSSRLMC